MQDDDDELPGEDNFAPGDQQEDFEDLDLQGDWFHGAVLWSTDWTTETILSQLKRGNIDLNPRYQRRSAWRERRKSSFIESLILGLPIPQLILAEDKQKRGAFIVIDGKQRLLTLRQFTATDRDKEFAPLKLTGLADRPDLEGIRYVDMLNNPTLYNELNTFENQTIRTVVIRNWSNEKYLYSVFLRINTGSVQLFPQELRQAISRGGFSDFIDDFSVGSHPLREALGLDHPDFRMRDAELALRFFAYQNDIQKYTGNLKYFLDQFTRETNKQWFSRRGLIEHQGDLLNSAIATTRIIFGDKAYLRKWNGLSYESRINRAVFDIMTYYFAEDEIADEALKKAAAIESRFKALCESHQPFRSSLEQTTKSLIANQIRFSVWGHALSEITGLNIGIPWSS